ncbi:MAG: cysteine peptidase family C39 domain-containing protein [Acidobacteriota bacterium]
MAGLRASQRRGASLLAPEVIQSSAMDCGPAVLQCLLRGFGIPAHYGRLREVCQTDVDGTSITTLEEVACELGLDAEQVLVPEDHLVLPAAENLPAVVVVLVPPGITHFVVVWRRHGRWLQVMDPASGRHWITERQFLRRLYRYTHSVPAAGWREWAGSDELLEPLAERLAALGASDDARQRLVAAATVDPDWASLAALDAAVRLTEVLASSRAVARGRRAVRLVDELFQRAAAAPRAEELAVPPEFWSVRPDPDSPADAPHLRLRGALLVRARGRREGARADAGAAEAGVRHLTPEVAAELIRPEPGPWRQLWQLLRGSRQTGSRWAPLAAGATVVGAAPTGGVEARRRNAIPDRGALD